MPRSAPSQDSPETSGQSARLRVRLAIALALLILGALGWFWTEQLLEVLETLALAYG